MTPHADDDGGTVYRARPDTHNALRVDAGMEPVDHCGGCWHVMEDGECPSCGCTTAWEDEQ